MMRKQLKFYNPFILFSHILFFMLEALFINVINLFKNEESAKTKEKYEDKYLKEYHELELKEYSDKALETLKPHIVEEETEKHGLVKIKYDVEEKQFIYYTQQTKDIPYSILDVLARKFVITHDCKCIFVDVRNELEISKKESIEKKNIKKQENPENDVFATFKPYNIKEEKNALIKNKINNYKYGGKVTELDEKKEIKINSISYSNFKNNM